MILKLAIKNLLHKPLTTLLCWLLLSVSVGMISLLLLLQEKLEQQFTGSIRDVDMVIGAKGSPLQLILSAVYHMDDPTGNIKYEEAQKWMRHPFIAWAVPLAYGDSYRGFSIVGTTRDYIGHYTGGVQQGKMFGKDFEVVLGHNVAKTLNLKSGSSFFGTHGDSKGGEEHREHPYKVVGILKPGGASSDNLIIGNIESVWAIHAHEEDHQTVPQGAEHADGEAEAHDAEHEEHHEPEEKELTAVLIKFRNPAGLIQLPRIINENTGMMAAVPAIEINRLFTLFGVGIDTLKAIGWGIMALAAFSVFIALFNALKDRKYELALMRTLGAGRGNLLFLLLLEALLLCAAAFISGLFLSRAALWFIGKRLAQEFHFSAGSFSLQWPAEGYLLLLTLGAGIAAALLPAIKAGRLNISKTLSHE